MLSRACPAHNAWAQEASPPSQSKLRKPPRVNNDKDFFLSKKKNAISGDPEAAAGSGLCSAAWKTQLLHRNVTTFHQMAETQHHVEQTLNKVPPFFSEHTVVRVLALFSNPAITLFRTCHHPYTIKTPLNTHLLDTLWRRVQNESICNSSSAAIREQTLKVGTSLSVWWWSFSGCKKCLCKWERELPYVCAGEGDSFRLACERELSYWKMRSTLDGSGNPSFHLQSCQVQCDSLLLDPQPTLKHISCLRTST